MAKWPLHFRRNDIGSSAVVIGGMSGVVSEPDVCDEVLLWHNGEPGVNKAGEVPLVIPPVYFFCRSGLIKFPQPIHFFSGIEEEPVEIAESPQLVVALYFEVEEFPRPTPRRPSPDIAVAGEIIGVVRVVLPAIQKVVSADMHNAGIVPVPLEQFLAKPEERFGGEAVIFENDPLFLMFEKPGKRRGGRDAAVEVFCPEERLDFAVPVDQGDDLSRLFAFCRVAMDVWPGAVGRDIEPGWPDIPDRFEDQSRRLRPVKNDQ